MQRACNGFGVLALLLLCPLSTLLLRETLTLLQLFHSEMQTAPLDAAFDLLSLNGKDLRDLPLLERKRRLLAVMPQGVSRALYVEHLASRGVDFYLAACQLDLEGIVAKWKHGRYTTDGHTTSWLKIKNPTYSSDGRPA